MAPSSSSGSRTRRTTMSSTMSSHSHSPSIGSISLRTRTSRATTPGGATTTTTKTTASSSSSTATGEAPSTSSSALVGETIGPEQHPQFLTPALPTPTWPGEQGTFSLTCSTTIRAPTQLLLALVLDTRTYRRWNPFSPTVRVTHQPRSTAPLPACLRGSPAIDAIANLGCTLRDGTEFVMDVRLEPKKGKSHHDGKRATTPGLQVSRLEQFTRDNGDDGDGGTTGGRIGVRLAWRIRGRVAELLTRSERVQEFVFDPRDPTVTEYVCWETYYGVLAGGMRHLYGRQIREGYSGWMEGLKGFAEAEWERQTAAAGS